MNEFIAFLKTKKFWTIFAIVTVADYLFFNRALAVVPLIPSLYQFYDKLGLSKLIPSKGSGSGSGSSTTVKNPKASAEL